MVDPSDRLYRILKWTGVILFCCSLSVVLAYEYLQGDSAGFLVVSHNDFVKNNGPLSVINLATGEIKKPQTNAVGCSGVAENRSSMGEGMIIVYCLGSNETRNLWDINLTDGSVTQHPEFSEPHKMIGVPLHPKVVIGSDGWQYYNDGGPAFLEDWMETNAGIVMTREGETYKVYVSDRSKQYFILRMVLDESEKKMWVMSMATDDSVLIDRINLRTRSIDFSYTLKTYSGYDMIMNDSEIILTTYRTREGVDVTVLDKHTGLLVKELTLPDEKDLGYNALSIIVRNDTLLVSSIGGMYVVDPKTYMIKDFIPNNPEGQFTYFIQGEGAIYAIDSYNKVVKITDTDPLHPKLILDATGQGLSGLYYYVNK